MQVIVFCEVTDAWSYLGATRFERASATFTILTGEPVEIAYRAAVPAEPASVADAVAPARISGIDLNVDDIIPADTTDAWRVLTWAGESGISVQRDLLQQLWRAHFLEGADIADTDTLSLRAALVGLDGETTDALLASQEYGEAVEQQRRLGAELGDGQLPFIVVAGTRTLSGLHAQDDYVDALQQIWREEIADAD